MTFQYIEGCLEETYYCNSIFSWIFIPFVNFEGTCSSRYNSSFLPSFPRSSNLGTTWNDNIIYAEHDSSKKNVTTTTNYNRWCPFLISELWYWLSIVRFYIVNVTIYILILFLFFSSIHIFLEWIPTILPTHSGGIKEVDDDDLSSWRRTHIIYHESDIESAL